MTRQYFSNLVPVLSVDLRPSLGLICRRPHGFILSSLQLLDPQEAFAKGRIRVLMLVLGLMSGFCATFTRPEIFKVGSQGTCIGKT